MNTLKSCKNLKILVNIFEIFRFITILYVVLKRYMI